MIWKKVAISEFLNERKDRFKPEEANSMNLKRINKIDFSGNIHLEKNKPTKTGMILIKSGDLVISGINADKGAISIYSGKEDVMATIHYSSYSYDSKKINIDYLKWYLKSKTFLNILKEQTKGGIKTELKAKKILPLVIDIPNLEGQKIVLDKINSINEECSDLAKLQTETIDNISQLKQSILQEAIQGKLTADWREQNPDTEPASELLKRIKAEKAQLIKDKKIKKEKPLSIITAEEIPFELPEGWVWCRLGEISDIQRGSSPRPKGDKRYFSVAKTKNNWISISDISSYCKENVLLETKEFLTDLGTKYSRFVDKNEFIIAVSGSTTGKCCLTGIEGYIYDGLAFVRLHNQDLYPKFLLNYMIQLYSHINNSKEGASFPNINTQFLKNMLYPLMTIEEQKAIVEKVEALMQKCQALEQEIKTSENNAQILMQAVLKEAFEGKQVVVGV